MEHLGQVFRFFREARHISLSEATGGEFSKSMLSRFENGQSELSAQKLFSALSAIHAETEEFTVAAGIQDHHSHKELLSQIQDLLQDNQINLLEELYLEKEKITRKSKSASDWVERLIVKAYLCALKESEKASPSELDFLHDYLFSVDIWGRYELNLFSVCTPVLSLGFFPNTPKKSSQERILLPCLPTIATPCTLLFLMDICWPSVRKISPRQTISNKSLSGTFMKKMRLTSELSISLLREN